MEETKFTKDDIKIIVDTSLDIENIDKIIKEGLVKSYNESKRFDKLYDSKQILFFITGVLFLLFSSLINNDVTKEVILIIGWFVIWEGVDIALNLDSKLRLNRKTLNKLINSEIIINKK